MRILITGGSGFIGTNLTDYFATRGDEVLNYDVAAPRNAAHFDCWQAGNLLDGGALKAVVRDFAPEAMLHMGARTDLDGRSAADYAANSIGVENLIAAVEGTTSLKRLIFALSLIHI